MVKVALSACLITFLSVDARADESEPSPTPAAPLAAPVEVPHVWYGWQTLTADGASALVGGIGFGASQAGAGVGQTFLIGGVALYAIGGPAVHIANGQPWRAVGSLGLRAVLPIVGIFGGLAAAPTCKNCGWSDLGMAVEAAAVGSVIGMVAASALDASLLAYKPGPTRTEPLAPRLALAPQVDPLHRTYGLSLVGSGF